MDNELSAQQQQALTKELMRPIVFPNPRHPSGRSTLLLHQLEAEEIIRRMEKVLDAK